MTPYNLHWIILFISVHHLILTCFLWGRASISSFLFYLSFELTSDKLVPRRLPRPWRLQVPIWHWPLCIFANSARKVNVCIAKIHSYQSRKSPIDFARIILWLLLFISLVLAISRFIPRFLQTFYNLSTPWHINKYIPNN